MDWDSVMTVMGRVVAVAILLALLAVSVAVMVVACRAVF
jgi:hypothetical protein